MEKKAAEEMDNESDGGSGRMSRPPSEVSLCPTEDEEDFTPMGPKCSIKEHLEKDKDDESLRRWKEQLLGSVDVIASAEAQEPDVKILSLTIISTDRPDIVLQMPESGSPKGLWFTLKEGSKYRLRFEIKVSNEIVCGLRYINTVWKTGLKVDGSKEMLGTFSPQAEPYTHEMPEETTPSGMFARGTYSARTKFIDDDKKCYLDINYTFDIQKDWATTS
ncbi:rho GDP-dissociation inhibitor 1-like [Ipomoea triloba]|uniref:rho GDP-dissociation inhibitor 1-like n=1 Tax=Ipomoea triloba TaxID=35885 RepID=UPI00125CF7F8|nr:rho GDP-dissociation inhibitor 1-like [Ipomoea triloba]